MVKNNIKIVEASFSLNLTKICNKNLGWNVLYFCGYDITYTGFKTFTLTVDENYNITNWIINDYTKKYNDKA